LLLALLDRDQRISQVLVTWTTASSLDYCVVDRLARGLHPEANVIVVASTVSFSEWAFVPVAVGFFGLATGYLIQGPEGPFKLPAHSRPVDSKTGMVRGAGRSS
jgi:hypothetical protein